MDFTHHAEIRLSQRGISDEYVRLVMQHGTKVYNGGALFVFMRHKDIPESVSGTVRDRLEGITLLLDPDSRTVITAYRNRQALKDIKRKKKYERWKQAA